VSWKRFTTHTGVFAASSGSGAPNVVPFCEFGPVVAVAMQFTPSGQLRVYRIEEPLMMGKLCEMPVQPLSRSLPVAGTVSVSVLPGSVVVVLDVQAGRLCRHWRTRCFAHVFLILVLPFLSVLVHCAVMVTAHCAWQVARGSNATLA